MSQPGFDGDSRSLHVGQRTDPLPEKVGGGIPHTGIVVALWRVNRRDETEFIAAANRLKRFVGRCVDTQSKAAAHWSTVSRRIDDAFHAEVDELRLLLDFTLGEGRGRLNDTNRPCADDLALKAVSGVRRLRKQSGLWFWPRMDLR